MYLYVYIDIDMYINIMSYTLNKHTSLVNHTSVKLENCNDRCIITHLWKWLTKLVTTPRECMVRMLIDCWCEYNMVYTLWKAAWVFFLLLFDQNYYYGKCTLGPLCQRTEKPRPHKNPHANLHKSLFITAKKGNNWDVLKQVMVKQSPVEPYHVIPLSDKK